MSKANRRFDKNEDQEIISYRGDYAAVRRRLPHRSESSIRNRAKQLGLAGGGAKPWTVDEDDVLRRCHPDFALAEETLPHRTPAAIRERCRMLGLFACNRYKWTADRIQVLEQIANVLSDREIAEILNAPKHAVAYMRQKLGVLRNTHIPKRPPVVPLVADIVRELRRRGISMMSVTRAVGRTPINSGATAQSVSFRSAVEVVEELGGELYVEWDD